MVGASATAVVSVGNTVESITIGAGGTGYTSAPTVTIETPVGLEQLLATANPDRRYSIFYYSFHTWCWLHQNIRPTGPYRGT